MKLYSKQLELKAIKSMAVANGVRDSAKDVSTLDVNDKTLISSLLLASVDESFFHYEPCKAAYRRLVTVSQKRSRIIDYHDLLEDPALNEEYRDILREYKKKGVLSKTGAEDLLDKLDEYRMTRELYYMAKGVIETLQQPEVDVKQLSDSVTEQLTRARSRESKADLIHTIGKDANATDLVEQALSPDAEKLLKTGWKEFDEKSGGLPSEGVLLMAATTSGGKSVTRMNLMSNLYMLNCIDVATVSLEMNEVKETRRMLSRLTKIPFWKFSKKALKDSEKDLARKKWKKFHKFGKKNGCKFSILAPTRSLTIQSLLMLLKPYKYKAIAIDYISLLEGVDGNDQWKALSAITRECKVFSGENKCLIILLAQLDSDDDRIRYSKGILEHVDNAIVWNYSKPEQRDLKVLPVVQKKARDGELYNFDLKEAFEIMTVLNMDDPTPTVEQDLRAGATARVGDDDVEDPLAEEKVEYDVS